MILKEMIPHMVIIMAAGADIFAIAKDWQEFVEFAMFRGGLMDSMAFWGLNAAAIMSLGWILL